jgi:hypothetical protein
LTGKKDRGTQLSVTDHTSDCLPLFDEMSRRFLNFINTIIRFIASCGIIHGRGVSLWGQNTAFCTQRYGCSYMTVMCESTNDVINNFVRDSQTDGERWAAAFLRGLLEIRDKKLYAGCLSDEETSTLIAYVSSCRDPDMSDLNETFFSV